MSRAQWDDFVDTPGGNSALSALVQGFEGGEGGVYGHGDGDEVSSVVSVGLQCAGARMKGPRARVVEGGAVVHSGLMLAPPQTDDTPIFSLGRVQFALPSPLHSLSCSSNVLLLSLTGVPRPPGSSSGGLSPQLIRIDLDHPTEVENIDLAIPPPVDTRDGIVSTLHRVLVDPTGRHVLVSTTTGDNFYVFIGTLPAGGAPTSGRRAKPLSRLKGAIIESVSWSPSSTSSSSASFSTREILLGTSTGQILETTLLDPALAESSSFSIPVPGRSGAPERYVKHLFTLPERQAITGLKCETWGKRAAIIVTTQTRIYQFVGSLSGRREEEGGMLEAVFQPYVSGTAQPSESSFDRVGDGPLIIVRQNHSNSRESPSTRSSTSSRRYVPTRRVPSQVSHFPRVSPG
jgi:hypothetical protein